MLSAAAAQAMRTPQIKAANFADQWGIGWDIRDFGGTRVISHGGSINGFQTHLTLVPAQGVAIAILTNSARGSAAVRNIEPAALEQVCGLRAPRARASRCPTPNWRASRAATSSQEPR